MTRRRLALLLTAGLLVSNADGLAQAPPMPQPGPEHALLKEDVGTWDAVVEIFGVPGEPKSKGVQVNTLGCGGLCLISDFKGELMPGITFHGHGTTAYDAARKRYVGSWTDSMSTGLSIAETTWDPASKTLSGFMEGPGPTGTPVKMRSTVVYKDDTRVFTAYGPGPDGKEAMAMRITYTKRN